MDLELTLDSQASKVWFQNERMRQMRPEEESLTDGKRRPGVPLLKRLGVYALILVIGFLL